MTILQWLLQDDEVRRTFSEQALWAAGESQKVTAIPALTLVASSSLLVVVLWIWGMALVWRRWHG